MIVDPMVDEELPAALTPAGTTMLLLVGGVTSEWAAETAVQLCARWSRAGRRLVLADLHVEQPVLHEALGVENLEGIVDVFLYGASISRSAQPVPGYGFPLIPAGTYEMESQRILRHPRWEKVVAGFRQAEAGLVLFAPTSSVDPEAMSRWVDEVILLGAPDDVALPARLADQGIPLRALLVPDGLETTAADEASDGASADGAVELTVEPARDALQDAGLEAPGSAPEDEDAELAIPPGRSASERRLARERRSLRPLVAILILAILVAAAGFMLARERPDLVPWLEPGGAPAPADDLPAAAHAAGRSDAARTGPPIPFAVLVRSHSSLSAAREHAERQAARFMDVPFYISPEDDGGVLNYRLYAGLLRDTASAGRLRERLLEEGVVEVVEGGEMPSLVHRAHLSFDLGEYESRERAEARFDSLAEQEIITYPVPMPYADGVSRWQLYGGAYRDSMSASAMQRQLAEAGLEPRLVLRVGEPAPAG